MGWWTMAGRRGDSLENRAAQELAPMTIKRFERKAAYGEETLHVLATAEGDQRPVWIVMLYRSDDMVKVMDETCGPYCEPCSKAFLAEAVKACAEPKGFAAAFRERMAA